MNPKQISTIALEPFIQKFVFTIIKTIQMHNLQYEKRQVIHADLVPRVSERVMQASLMDKKFPTVNEDVITSVVPKRDMSELIAPIRKPIAPRIPMQVAQPIQQLMSPRQIPQQVNLLKAQKEIGLSQDYGKITPLLNDPSVSSIECQGVGKPLMIIRAGQRQITRITLSAKEIKEILQRISDAVHIPILEGVFRAAVDNFSVNAVISSMIGSRFVIKKQTAYALLER